ncbi:hypothetical protein OG874_32680 [Nocardia sp. NBC_00565]|uniref:hypothetical protein n=1 Tax=Nocardia sp. NBC_00565 TaxID=2975993 RepID=UPI002E81818C|nr:hypothetical protein [Nocardia sp. NBC_00565]WUC01519.1 hypothetical protein OG874_32680 [Nocardia sp. NBC_00565]
MDLPAIRDDEDARKLALAPEGGGPRYLHQSDGSWSFVGPDGWPVEPDEYAELDADVANALAAVNGTVVDEDLLIAVRRGLLDTIDVEPISVTDTEV